MGGRDGFHVVVNRASEGGYELVERGYCEGRIPELGRKEIFAFYWWGRRYGSSAWRGLKEVVEPVLRAEVLSGEQFQYASRILKMRHRTHWDATAR